MLKKIIIIDDEPINCFIVEQLCKKLALSSEISSYSDSSIALSILKKMSVEELPELLFIDLNMPMISGWELLESIREKLTLAHSKVIILTSSLLDEDKVKADNDVLINSFLIKPVDLEMISTLAKKIL